MFFDAYRRGGAPVIYGDGEQSRDFTYVADAVEANLLAAGAPEAARGRAFNVAAGRQYQDQSGADPACRIAQ